MFPTTTFSLPPSHPTPLLPANHPLSSPNSHHIVPAIPFATAPFPRKPPPTPFINTCLPASRHSLDRFSVTAILQKQLCLPATVHAFLVRTSRSFLNPCQPFKQPSCPPSPYPIHPNSFTSSRHHSLDRFFVATPVSASTVPVYHKCTYLPLCTPLIHHCTYDNQ